MTHPRDGVVGGRVVAPLCTALIVLLAGCNGDGSAGDEEPGQPGERPAAAADAGTREPPACRLGPWSPAGPGLRVRLPQSGITLPGWTIRAVQGDRDAAMATISDEGGLTVREVEAPAAKVYYTVEELEGPEEGAAAYRVRVAYRHDRSWYRAGLPIQGPDREQVESCLALMPEALATLRSTERSTG